MPGVKGQSVEDDDTVVTQLGYIRSGLRGIWSFDRLEFRCGPRPRDKGQMSVLEGRFDVNTALMRVTAGCESADG